MFPAEIGIWQVELGLNSSFTNRRVGDTLEVLAPLHGRCAVFSLLRGSLYQANEVLDLDHLFRSRESYFSKTVSPCERFAAEIPALEIYGRKPIAHIWRRFRFAESAANAAHTRIVAEAIAAAEACTQRNVRQRPKPQSSSLGLIR